MDQRAQRVFGICRQTEFRDRTNRSIVAKQAQYDLFAASARQDARRFSAPPHVATD